MAAVPFPLMSEFHGEEIGRSLVFHSLWEPQQDSVVQLSHPRMIRRPGGKNTGNEHPQILPVCEDVSSLFFFFLSLLLFIHSTALEFTWKVFPQESIAEQWKESQAAAKSPSSVAVASKLHQDCCSSHLI